MKKIVIINGVNLGCLGTREVNLYGTESFTDYFALLQKRYPHLQLQFFQSESLEDLVTCIHKNGDATGLIINPGAYTHTSLVLADAIKAVNAPTIEVHITNIYNRESYRKKSFIASSCVGTISGLGLKGYELAVQFFSTSV